MNTELESVGTLVRPFGIFDFRKYFRFAKGMGELRMGTWDGLRMGRERNSKRLNDWRRERNPRIPNSDSNMQKDRIRMLCYVMNLWLIWCV